MNRFRVHMHIHPLSHVRRLYLRTFPVNLSKAQERMLLRLLRLLLNSYAEILAVIIRTKWSNIRRTKMASAFIT
jgi:hypothetical protein